MNELNKNQNEELIDPMAFDTEDDLKGKEEKWSEIFLRCPDLSNTILDLYEKDGECAMLTLDKLIKEKFDEFAKSHLTV